MTAMQVKALHFQVNIAHHALTSFSTALPRSAPRARHRGTRARRVPVPTESSGGGLRRMFMRPKVRKKAAERRRELREEMWPGADKIVWTRHTDDGYSTVPRTL